MDYRKPLTFGPDEDINQGKEPDSEKSKIKFGERKDRIKGFDDMTRRSK